MSKWPMVRLGEVLTKSDELVPIQPDRSYKEVTVRLWGKGAVLRHEVLGAEIASSTRLQVHANQFIISRIDARNGASGLIPADLEGAVVSNDFPVFTPNPTRMAPAFLGWLSKTKTFVELCKTASEGTTNRVRLKESRFLETEIPLPPLAEQRRVVERIDALAAKVGQARQLRREALQEQSALSSAILTKLVPSSTTSRPLVELISPGTTISYGVLVPGGDEPVGVPFVRIQDLDPSTPPALPSKRIAPSVDAQYARTRLRGDEVLVAVVGATIGKVGTVPPTWIGANIARAVCRIIPGPLILREFLISVLRSQAVQEYFRNTTRTLAQPTLNVGQLEQTPIPEMPLPRQREILDELRRLQSRLQLVDGMQAKTGEELDAMLPAILDRAFQGELQTPWPNEF